MRYTIPTKDGACARGSLPISTSKAVKICRVVNRKKLDEVKKILNEVYTEKRSIDGKYYTKAVKEILNLLNTVESNARQKGLDPDKLIVYISAHKGPTLLRARRKRDFGLKLKMCHVQIVLKGEKIGRRKKVRKSGNKK
jgi:ribosomal protein L22